MTPAQVTEVLPYEQECLTCRLGEHARRSRAVYLLSANSGAVRDGVPVRYVRGEPRRMLSCRLLLRTGRAVRMVFAGSEADADGWILRRLYHVLIVRLRERAAAAGARLHDLWKLRVAECGDRAFGRF